MADPVTQRPGSISDLVCMHLVQYTLLEGSCAMWENLQGAHGHLHIARHFWTICQDSSVTVCIDLHNVSGDMFLPPLCACSCLSLNRSDSVHSDFGALYVIYLLTYLLSNAPAH